MKLNLCQTSRSLGTARGLTLRSSGTPTARRTGHQAQGLRPILRLLSSASRRWRPLSSTLGPERLPVHRDFAQRRQTRIFDCSGRSSHQCGREVRVRCFSQTLRQAPCDYECLACSHHIDWRSKPTPLPKHGGPNSGTLPRQRPNDRTRAPSPTQARPFSKLVRLSVVRSAAHYQASSVLGNTNTILRLAFIRVM